MSAWAEGRRMALAATKQPESEFDELLHRARRALRGAPALSVIEMAVNGAGYLAAAHFAEDRMQQWQYSMLAELGAAYARLAEAGGWLVWAFEHEVMVLPRPAIVAAAPDRYGGQGPTVVWPNGEGWQYNRGWRRARATGQHTGSLDPYLDILWERNPRLRRELIDEFGMVRFVEAVGRELRDCDERGKLWRIPLAGDEPLCVVEVVNTTAAPDGTFEHHFLRVPPTLTTAAGAVAWTFGLAASDYHPTTET